MIQMPFNIIGTDFKKRTILLYLPKKRKNFDGVDMLLVTVVDQVKLLSKVYNITKI